ncbi:hypothetical protein CHUAL_008401 [Chamberlinius hualienensis]
MKLQRSNKLLSVTICLLAVVYSGSGAPPACCDFEVYNCASPTTWTWTATATPPIQTPPPWSSGYIWTQTPGAQALFPTVTVKETDSFSFYYYIADLPANLNVTFFPTVGAPVTLAIIPYSGVYTWIYASPIHCSSCCGGSASCDGQLSIEAVETVGTVVAVDDVFLNYDDCF